MGDDAITDARQRLWKKLLDHSFEMITLSDANGVILYASPSSERALGYAPREIVGRSMRHLLHADDDAARAERMRAMLATPGSTLSFRYRALHNDGAWRWFEADAQNLIHDDDVGAILVRSRDLTAEARFRALADNLSDGLMTLDAKGNIIYVNPAVSRIAGWSPEERVGRNMSEYVHPDDRELVRATFASLLETGTGNIDALRILTKDGSMRIVEGTSARLPPHNDGAVVAISYRDITERHALAAKLAANERRFRALTEKSGGTVLVCDAEGNVLDVSRPSPLGIAQTERVGRNIFDRIHPDDVERVRAAYDEVLATAGSSRSIETRARHERGLFIFIDCVLTNLIDDPAVRGVVVNYRDITDRVVAEEQLRKAHRLEAIGRLAAGVAHDFNNLLVGILGYASLLSATLTDPARLEDVEQIKIAGERAADLTRQILAFSRRQLLKRDRVDVNALLRDLVKLLRRVTKSNVEIDLHADDGVRAVYADAGQLEHAIVNLSVNASDAMPEGGKLTISTANVAIDVDDGELKPGPHVSIRVSDTGVGMSADVMQHIFEPFFTTKELGRGTGLGLATVHGVVHQHGGRIRVVDSVPGRGTTFEILLPATDAAPSVIEPRRAVIAGGRGELVLVADDDEIARRITVRLLERAGYRVLVAHNGAEALTHFTARPDVALVVLDVVMPDMTGPQALARMEQLRPGVKFLFASGYAWEPGETDERIARRSLQKPFDLDELLRRVREALDEVTR